MSSTPYLARLTTRLTRGARRLPRGFRERQTGFLLTQEKRGGGFGGRRGPADLYYTGFALRAVALLDVDSPKPWNDAAAFIRKNATEPADLTDAFSLLVARVLLEARGIPLWCEACRDERLAAIRDVLADARRDDGGFAKTPGGAMSLYHTFLAMLCFELLGEPFPDAASAAELVRARQCSSGAFGDVEPAGAEGTNPTAAALGVLQTLDALDVIPTCRDARAFLVSMQRADGGFAATPGAPASDLMSSFTALAALGDTGSLEDVRLGDLGRYVKSLALERGGFRGSPADEATDVEYTYYGLGVLALLAEAAASRRSCCPGDKCRT